jgi:agmatinase
MSSVVRKTVAALLERGELPVVLGGEHSVTIGAVDAAADRFDDLTVLQIDAHADTREEYEGSSHNHACVMARARERCPIVQVGIRAVDSAEMPDLDADRVFWAHDIVGAADDSWMDEVAGLLTGEVYVTIDLDAFDPSLIPATGTPEPGGLEWYPVNRLLRRVVRASRVVGFDVVELLPAEGQHASAFAAAKLVYRFLAEIEAARDA